MRRTDSRKKCTGVVYIGFISTEKVFFIYDPADIFFFKMLFRKSFLVMMGHDFDSFFTNSGFTEVTDKKVFFFLKF